MNTQVQQTTRLHDLAIAVPLSLVIAVGAHLTVSAWLVPATLQSLVVLAIGGIYGRRIGLAATAAYLLEGLCGLPVFAHGGGFAVFAGPTGGYLAAMPIMAVLASQGFFGMVRAMMVCYFMGAMWLSQYVGINAAINIGVTPFLLGDSVKLVLAWAISQIRKS